MAKSPCGRKLYKSNNIIFFSDELENKFSKDINYISKLFLKTIKYELGFHDAVYD